MKGARINFGVPNSEYVLLADDDGVAVSLKNQDTDTEYIGGGGDYITITSQYYGELIIAEVSAPVTAESAVLSVIKIDIPEIDANSVVSVPRSTEIAILIMASSALTITGDYEEIEFGGNPCWLITGDVTVSAA